MTNIDFWFLDIMGAENKSGNDKTADGSTTEKELIGSLKNDIGSSKFRNSVAIVNDSQNHNDEEHEGPFLIGRKESMVDLKYFDVARQQVLRKLNYLRNGSIVDLFHKSKIGELKRKGSSVDDRLFKENFRNEPQQKQIVIGKDTTLLRKDEKNTEELPRPRSGSAVDPLYGYSSQWPEALSAGTRPPRPGDQEVLIKMAQQSNSSSVDPGYTFMKQGMLRYDLQTSLSPPPSYGSFASGRSVPISRGSLYTSGRITPSNLPGYGRISPYWN